MSPVSTVCITGIGAELPADVITTSAEVQPSELATARARMPSCAGVDPLFAGITRDCLEPATANLVAEAVGACNARVFDLINACNGLVDAIDVGDSNPSVYGTGARPEPVVEGRQPSERLSQNHSVSALPLAATGTFLS